ncbi:hypothetical protein ES332_D01G190200v1 [Gossypium tomentosum]|uniref:Uncharacterized protein n=1 Tax=Gossypium tomentosum TaxID=34277 RepID=A0A5D2MBI6_GOSTO|nr:hypothetical protein ES332_D01G190200v1 [Gossypium tomentosum]
MVAEQECLIFLHIFFLFPLFLFAVYLRRGSAPETQKSPVTGSGPPWPVNKILLFKKKCSHFLFSTFKIKRKNTSFTLLRAFVFGKWKDFSFLCFWLLDSLRKRKGAE